MRNQKGKSLRCGLSLHAWPKGTYEELLPSVASRRVCQLCFEVETAVHDIDTGSVSWWGEGTALPCLWYLLLPIAWPIQVPIVLVGLVVHGMLLRQDSARLDKHP